MENDISIGLHRLWGRLNKVVWDKSLAECLTQSKHSINARLEEWMGGVGGWMGGWLGAWVGGWVNR